MRSTVPGVYWAPSAGRWRVHLRRGPHAGSYGYFDDQDEAEQTALLAAAGKLAPGANTATRYRTERRSAAGPRKPYTVSETASPRSGTGVRGVSFNQQSGKYHVRIKVDGRYCSFGLHEDLGVAAEIARQVYAGERVPLPRSDQPKPARSRTPQVDPFIDPHRDKRAYRLTEAAIDTARTAAKGRKK
ncbi:hypothetical protein [Mycobacteroides abscessus]|uniref:hypothetical protein n=1 Tax=Mycobacteroides abscessus TaxID=36809 RepID=UPI0009A6C17A|nr:hypothetical protein [Mycobacteroides abscessus]